MPGFRKESSYIEKYGMEIGKLKYKEIVNKRTVRDTRRSINFIENNDSILNGDAVQCCACGKIFKRITRTHLKNTCIDNITPEEYKIKYPNAEIVAKNLTKLFSNTEKSMKEKYGEESGSAKWKNYREIQAETNTFDYKSKKYNMSKDEFDNYNKSRSATLKNFIERHGEEIGLDKWEEYCERQRYTTTIDYFIERYGKELGTNKYDKFCLDRNLANCKQSKKELEVFDEIENILQDIQRSVRLHNPHYGPFDYGNVDKKKLIEFYGTYWHGDPRFYTESAYHCQKRMTFGKIRSRDQAKQTFAVNNGYSIFVIWEYDWDKNKIEMIQKLKEFWYEK